MKLNRPKVLGALWMLHGAVAFGAGMRAAQMELDSKSPFWGDIILFGGVGVAIAAGFLFLANRAYRKKRGWLLFAMIAAGFIGSLEIGLGTLLIVMALSGATDSYIGPMGGVFGFAGATHATMAWLAWSLWSRAEQ